MPDVHELGNVLRKSLEAARRTHQMHLKAMEGIESAIVAYERAMMEQTEDLTRDRAALDDERRAFEDERLQTGPALDGNFGEEHVVQDEEADPLAEFADTHGEGYGRPNETPPHGRMRDRSRSRSRNRSHAGGNEAVRAAAARAGLDENASRQIQQFPPDEALGMLDQIPQDVRNPSAFVTKMCQRAHQPPGSEHNSHSQSAGPADSDRIENSIADIGLDESAARVIRELPQSQALNILDQIDGNVRNPSAFIMSLAHRTQGKGKGKGHHHDRGGPSREERIEDGIQRYRLDHSASTMLSELSPDRALSILDALNDDVRNPSAYVTAEARKILGRHDGGGGGKGGKHSEYGGGGGGKGGAPSESHVSGQIDNLARQLELDSNCADALRGIHPQDAVQILERLAVDISTIRNRSAFVFAEVKKRSHRGGPPPPSSTPKNSSMGGGGGGKGGTARVPCKFFGEGRCKNGAECRFSHE